MFKIPNGIPSLKTSPQEWADYAEFKTIKEGTVSLLNLISGPSMVDDETNDAGIEDDTDRFNNKIDEIAEEIRTRLRFTKSNYPFILGNYDYTIEHNSAINTNISWVYKFLLLSTRLNMKDNKVQNGIDGTQIFEKLSAEIATSFFGSNAQVEILGTSKMNEGGFRAKLGAITKKMGEGGTIHENKGYKPQDDNIDVVLWKGFSDKKSSQIIAFGQCKTGTSWQDNLSELNSEAFCKTWFSVQPVLNPLRMFFCSQYFPREIWRPKANEAGLVFDRFRIMDYLPDNLNSSLLDDIITWCNGAESVYKLD